MENGGNYQYNHDSGESSPRSREIDGENAVNQWEDQPPPPPSNLKVKLMCSYNGRIQPRAHDNQLSYVGGDTKIVSVDRSIRFPSFLTKLATLTSSSIDEICLKYQLPGEDLDALISVTNDEDLEHMMAEYDRLIRSGCKPAARLRLFVFAVSNPGPKADRVWFVDSVPILDPAPVVNNNSSPDYLFGLDKGFVPPAAVKVKNPAGDPPAQVVVKEETPVGEPVASPVEIQKQMQEFQRFQIADNQQQQLNNTTIQRNGSDETLTRVYNEGYYVPRVQEQQQLKAAAAPPPANVQVANQAYWQEQQRNIPPPARFASVANGDQQYYLIPAPPGAFQAGSGYYTTMRMMPADGFNAAMYTMPPTTNPVTATQAPPAQQSKAAYDSGVSAGFGNGAQAAYDNAIRAQGVDVSSGFGNGAAQVAYDSNGRAVYYTGAAQSYQTVGNVAMNAESKVLKPSQVS